jgi:hypothetical protein
MRGSRGMSLLTARARAPSGGWCQATLAGHTVCTHMHGSRGMSLLTARARAPSGGRCQATLAGHTVCTQMHGSRGMSLLTARARGRSGGRCQATLAGHSDYVLALALAQGAPLLASAGLRGQVCLWDLHAAAQAAGQVRAARPACGAALRGGHACLLCCVCLVRVRQGRAGLQPPAAPGMHACFLDRAQRSREQALFVPTIFRAASVNAADTQSRAASGACAEQCRCRCPCPTRAT